MTAVVADKVPGQLTLYLNPKQPVPILPYELHEHVSSDSWAQRIPQLIRLAKRYNKPGFEALWTLLVIIASIAVPAGLHNLILNNLRKGHPNDDNFYSMRWISMGIGIGVFIGMWIPIFVWKAIGQSRISSLVKRWQVEDARGKPPGAFVPTWSVKLPGGYSDNTKLIITTPNVPFAATAFNPAAYMPSWINGPMDPGANSGYSAPHQGFQNPAMYGNPGMYGPPGNGAPAMYGAVPIYGNPPGAVPPYTGNMGSGYVDEKSGFYDDTKV